MSTPETYPDKHGYLRYCDSDYLVHRRVMEKKLGRRLERGEIVHHINGDKAQDNRKREDAPWHQVFGQALRRDVETEGLGPYGRITHILGQSLELPAGLPAVIDPLVLAGFGNILANINARYQQGGEIMQFGRHRLKP